MFVFSFLLRVLKGAILTNQRLSFLINPIQARKEVSVGCITANYIPFLKKGIKRRVLFKTW